MSLRKSRSDQESREFWQHAEETAREVEQWPDWKKCITTVRLDDALTSKTAEQGDPRSDLRRDHSSLP